jgi:hypothetical protein
MREQTAPTSRPMRRSPTIIPATKANNSGPATFVERVRKITPTPANIPIATANTNVFIDPFLLHNRIRIASVSASFPALSIKIWNQEARIAVVIKDKAWYYKALARSKSGQGKAFKGGGLPAVPVEVSFGQV